jgi:hypothetical protein
VRHPILHQAKRVTLRQELVWAEVKSLEEISEVAAVVLTQQDLTER